jgi:hypothetical protein
MQPPAIPRCSEARDARRLSNPQSIIQDRLRLATVDRKYLRIVPLAPLEYKLVGKVRRRGTRRRVVAGRRKLKESQQRLSDRRGRNGKVDDGLEAPTAARRRSRRLSNRWSSRRADLTLPHDSVTGGAHLVGSRRLETICAVYN